MFDLEKFDLFEMFPHPCTYNLWLCLRALSVFAPKHALYIRIAIGEAGKNGQTINEGGGDMSAKIVSFFWTLEIFPDNDFKEGVGAHNDFY